MSKEEFSTEAAFRKKLIAIRLEFMRQQAEISQEMVPFAFSSTLPEVERESLYKLLVEVADDFEKNRVRVEELLLSNGPLLVVINPNEQH